MNDASPSQADASTQDASAFFLRLLDQLPFGVAVYHLDEPDDPGSLRLVQANDAASRAIGFDAKAEIGKTFRESLPQALETDLPATSAEVARAGVGRDLGEVEYGDERVENGVFEILAFPLPDRHVGIAFTEVTQRKSTENRLRLLTSAVENARDSVVITGPRLDEPGPEILYVNPAFTDLTGYTIDEVVGKTPRILQGPETDRAVMDRLRTRLEAGETFSGETVNYRKDGTPFVMRWDIAPLRNAEGAITHWVATQRDVTERRRDEERLRKSETELRSLAEATFEGVALTENGRVLLVNERFCEMMGFEPGELIGVDLMEAGLFTVAPEARADVEARLREGTDGSYETTLRRKDGSTFPAEIRGRMIPYGGREVRAAAVRDITERVETLEAIRRQALRFRGVFDSAFQFIFLLRPDGTLVEANRTALDFAGLIPADVIGEPIWDTHWWGLTERVGEDLRDAVGRAVRGELVRYVVDVSGYGDRIATLDLSIKPIADEDGHVELLIAEGRDVTEDVRTQRELRQLQETQQRLAVEEARYRSLVDATSAIVWTMPPTGEFDSEQAAWSAFTGQPTDALAGWGWLDAVHPDDRERTVEAWKEALEEHALFETEHRLRRHDGVYRWMAVRAAPIAEDEGAVREWVGAHTDIHERIMAEEALAEVNRTLEKRVEERTRALAAFSEDLKALHRITTAEHDDSDDAFQGYLRAGCDMFEMPIGILSETPLDEATGERVYRLRKVEAPGADIEPGLEIPLREAFCDAVVEAEETVSYADAAARAELDCHPAYAERGLRSFIGTPIYVGNELFGTLNFVSPEPRTEGFAPHEHELIEVMAELIGRLINARRAERERAEIDARYRSMVHTIDEGLLLVGAGGEVLMSNPAAQRMLGLGEGEAYGRISGSPRYRVVHEDGSPYPEEELPEREVLRTGRPVRGVIQGIVHPGGETRWYSVNARAAERSDDGDIRSVVVSFTDVTEQRQAEVELRESEAQLRNAQQIAHIGSWRWDIADDDVHWSDELYRIFGLTPDVFEPTYENYIQHVHPEDRDSVDAVVRRAMTQRSSYEVNHRVLQADETVRYVHSIGEVILDESGEPAALQGTAQDVTEQRKAEQAMERYADDLEERNAELEQFAYVASHDLQEPLRMVSSFLQLLQRRYADELDETADEYIAYAVDGAKRMQVLIRDLLAYSRVGTRGKPFKPVDMNRTLEVVLTDLGPALEEEGADVQAEDLPTVSADETQMRQLLQNLVANAVKFRDDEPPVVRVSAERVRQGDDPAWRFAVADNGIGIDAQYEDRVFQIFQRLHTRDEYEGTGIGLAMCKKIVERHGGRIWFESEPGEGTTFFFTVPIRPDAASSDAAPLPSPSDPTPTRSDG